MLLGELARVVWSLKETGAAWQWWLHGSHRFWTNGPTWPNLVLVVRWPVPLWGDKARGTLSHSLLAVFAKDSQWLSKNTQVGIQEKGTEVFNRGKGWNKSPSWEARDKGAAYVGLMWIHYSFPEFSEESFNLQQAPKWKKSCLYKGSRKEIFTHNTFIRGISDHRCGLWWNKKQISSMVSFSQSHEAKFPKPVSQTVLLRHECFVPCLSGRKCLSQCGRPVFEMEILPMWHPLPDCPPPLPQDPCPPSAPHPRRT